jgi:ketosteroid isomerase-like protein
LRPASWLLLAVALAGMPAAAAARPPGGGQPAGAGDAFARVAAAFEAGDADALAGLVHPDGLRVTGHSERAGQYSPAQALYFFRNLFQAQRTLVFTFRKTQDEASGRLARGLAEWKRRRVDSEKVVDQQLVLVLARDGRAWGLVEINLMR